MQPPSALPSAWLPLSRRCRAKTPGRVSCSARAFGGKSEIYDERFWPAYYEDNDYRRRMEDAGFGFFRVETGAALQSDSTRRRLSTADAAKLERRVARNHAYFIQKRGGPPWAERFELAASGRSEKLARQ